MQSPEIISEITCVETIASCRSVKARLRLVRDYGFGNWMKRKGFAEIRRPDGAIVRAELHWYEAHGIGKREMKVKREVE